MHRNEQHTLSVSHHGTVLHLPQDCSLYFVFRKFKISRHIPILISHRTDAGHFNTNTGMHMLSYLAVSGLYDRDTQRHLLGMRRGPRNSDILVYLTIEHNRTHISPFTIPHPIRDIDCDRIRICHQDTEKSFTVFPVTKYIHTRTLSLLVF
jgi:hypothetical protein